MTLSESLKEASRYKKAHFGESQLTRKEIQRVREEYLKEKKAALEEKKNASKKNTSFAIVLKEAAAYKESQTGSGVLSRDEIKKLREAYKMTVNARAKLTEAKRCIIRGRRALREDDMQGAVDATQQAVDTMGQVDPNVVNVDPQIQASIQAVLDATNQLAQQAGISQGDDLTSDPNAGVEGVTGAPATDPNAAADPNAGGLVERAQKRRDAVLNEKKIGNGSVGSPSEKELAKGHEGGNGADVANIWKPTPIKYSKTGSLSESKTEKMVDDVLNENKMNFKELIKNGFFG